MFSVHQMHPEAALRLALGATLGGLARQDRSLQSMIQEHRTGLVVMGTGVEYLRESSFFSGPFVGSEAGVALRDDGKLMVFRVRHSAAGEDAIAVQIFLRPIELTGGPALDALPAPVNGAVRAMFDPDEIVPKDALPTRRLGADVRRWTAGAEKIGGGRRPVFLGRGDCEFAEQWFFARLPSIVASAREHLLFDGVSGLAASADKPLAAFHGEFFRPMFFGDRGTIEVEAHRKDDRIVVVHRVLGTPIPGAGHAAETEGGTGGRLCALAVEIF
jgi:hypothetical protein